MLDVNMRLCWGRLKLLKSRFFGPGGHLGLLCIQNLSKNQVLGTLLITLQALEARVAALEAQVSSLSSAPNTANQIIANTAATATTAAQNTIQALLLLGQ